MLQKHYIWITFFLFLPDTVKNFFGGICFMKYIEEYIDLHVHSSASDGTMTPAEVVDCAAKAGLSAVALTDHDTVAGVAPALEAARIRADKGLYSPEVIPGTELSCIWEHDQKKTELHMLGLFVDCKSGALCAFLNDVLAARERRNDEILQRLAADHIYLSRQELTGGNPDAVITRAHFASALISKGIVSTTDQAFRRYLAAGGKYCPPKETVSPEKAVQLILQSGGFPVLAHPMRYHLSWKEIELLTGQLTEAGLAGLDVYYSSHTREQSQRLRELCRRFRLLPTGGSDFHGAKKPDIHMGTGYGGLRVSKALLDDIKSALVQIRSSSQGCDGLQQTPGTPMP